jgi:hypothetical protein
MKNVIFFWVPKCSLFIEWKLHFFLKLETSTYRICNTDWKGERYEMAQKFWNFINRQKRRIGKIKFSWFTANKKWITKQNFEERLIWSTPWCFLLQKENSFFSKEKFNFQKVISFEFLFSFYHIYCKFLNAVTIFFFLSML